MLIVLRDFFRTANRKYYFDFFVVFILALLLFSWLTAAPVFPDPDAFYHAKMASQIGQGQLIQQFPWLSETVLKEGFIDHHFLYHVMLVPFVKLFNPLIGVKLASIFFVSFLCLVIYWLFKKFQVRYPFIFMIVLLSSGAWLFRAGLVKAAPVFLILLLLFFYAITHGKWKVAFLLSFLSVWLYSAWPLVLVLAGLYFLVYWLLEKLRLEDAIWFKLKNFFSRKKALPWPVLIYTFSGCLAGLIINPYFPKNILFYWWQIFNIGVVNYQGLIAVGNEWYAYGFLNLVNDLPLLFAVLTAALLIFILTFKKQSIYSWLWLILTVLFFLLTLKSKRYVELFVPLAVIFSAFSFGDYFKRLSNFHLKMLMHVGWQALFGLIIFVLGLGFLWRMPADILGIKTALSRGLAYDYYQEPALWLKQNAPADTVVFNADWDDFPPLFYYNDRNYYISGLDPTFMYLQNSQKYQDYVDITLGDKYTDLDKIIGEEFKANFVLLDKKHVNFNRNLKYNSNFVNVYSDEQSVIYRLNK